MHKLRVIILILRNLKTKLGGNSFNAPLHTSKPDARGENTGIYLLLMRILFNRNPLY